MTPNLLSGGYLLNLSVNPDWIKNGARGSSSIQCTYTKHTIWWMRGHGAGSFYIPYWKIHWNKKITASLLSPLPYPVNIQYLKSERTYQTLLYFPDYFKQYRSDQHTVILYAHNSPADNFLLCCCVHFPSSHPVSKLIVFSFPLKLLQHGQ